MSRWSKYGIHKGLFLWPSIWLVLAWSIFLLEEGTGIPLRRFGIVPGDFHSWYGPITFPWLHSDVNHIFSNTISLFFVGTLIRYSFPKIFDRVWFISLMAPGFLLWFIGRPNVHIGGSAWLYAMVAFVFFSGVLRLHIKLLAQSLLMVFLYGSFVWGVLPHDPAISYEGHLSGAVVGVILALYYRKSEPIESLRNEERTQEAEVLWDDWKHPFDRELDFEKISPTSDKQSKRPQGQQFRYEDGSSPDELA